MHLNLLVIKTHKLHELATFYRLLGLEFEYHKHDQGPFHYSAKLGETVAESSFKCTPILLILCTI